MNNKLQTLTIGGLALAAGVMIGRAAYLKVKQHVELLREQQTIADEE